jgi:hypothetical protein
VGAEGALIGRYARAPAARCDKERQGFEMNKSAVVHSDPKILGGTPVFVGTRVPVQVLFDYLEAGDSPSTSIPRSAASRRSRRWRWLAMP